MKKIKSLIVLLIILTTIDLESQPCPYDLVFENQEEVDNFSIEYPNCSEIEGNVTIGIYPDYSDITNLDGLNIITKIGGRLDIRKNPGLTSLSGLNNLTSIGENPQIWIRGLRIQEN